MNNGMTQIDLGLAPGRQGRLPVLVEMERVARIRSLRDAYRRCIDESEMTLGEVAAYLDIDEAQFNRVLNGGGRHLDDSKLHLLEMVCGNKIPTQWLAYQDGYELRPIRSALERQLLDQQEENSRLRLEIETLVKYGVLGQRK